MAQQATAQGASTQRDSIFSRKETEHQHQHTDAPPSLLDLLLALPVALFFEQVWPHLCSQTRRALFCSCQAMRQLIVSHLATRLVLPIDHWHLSRHVPPLVLPRPPATTKLTTLYICISFYGNPRRRFEDVQVTLQLTDPQLQLIASTLEAAGQQSNPIYDLSVSFADAALSHMLATPQHSAPLLLTTQLLSVIISNFQFITCLTLSNFYTDTSGPAASEHQAPVPICSLAPLQHAPNLTSLSFQQDTWGPFVTRPVLTWEFLCTLPLLLKLERLEVSNISGPVTQPFLHTLPALTHIAFTLTDTEYGLREPINSQSHIELIRNQHSLASIDNLAVGLSDLDPHHEQRCIAGLQSVKRLTVNGFLTNNLAQQLASVVEIVACGFCWSAADLHQESIKLLSCTKLCILRYEVEPNDLDHILELIPNLQHLEASIYLCPKNDNWQAEVSAYFATPSSGVFSTLCNSCLQYLSLQLVQSDKNGVVDTNLLAEVQHIVSEFPFQVEVPTILLGDFAHQQDPEYRIWDYPSPASSVPSF